LIHEFQSFLGAVKQRKEQPAAPKNKGWNSPCGSSLPAVVSFPLPCGRRRPVTYSRL
jgi:hypothetical protein